MSLRDQSLGGDELNGPKFWLFKLYWKLAESFLIVIGSVVAIGSFCRGQYMT